MIGDALFLRQHFEKTELQSRKLSRKMILRFPEASLSVDLDRETIFNTISYGATGLQIVLKILSKCVQSLVCYTIILKDL